MAEINQTKFLKDIVKSSQIHYNTISQVLRSKWQKCGWVHVCLWFISANKGISSYLVTNTEIIGPSSSYDCGEHVSSHE